MHNFIEIIYEVEELQTRLAEKPTIFYFFY
jgi:hypothetical protein